MCLQFGFLNFWQKDFGAKAAHKMLVKFTPGRAPYVTIETPSLAGEYWTRVEVTDTEKHSNLLDT